MLLLLLLLLLPAALLAQHLCQVVHSLFPQDLGRTFRLFWLLIHDKPPRYLANTEVCSPARQIPETASRFTSLLPIVD